MTAVAHPEPSEYDARALSEIAQWRSPSSSWYSRLTGRAAQTWNDVTDLIRMVPGVEWTMDNVVAGLLDLTNEITQDSVWIDAVFKDFRDSGHDIENHEHIGLLDLEQVDRITMGLDTKYASVAAAEGAATGLAGAAGILPDLIGLVSINLRATGEYASYYGFDIRDPRERLFALELLDHVAQPSTGTKDMTFSPAVRTASRVARTQSSQALEQMGVMSAIERAARALGIHLTGAKLAQIVPITGAFIAGGFNAVYTTRVCTSARNLYRERFLVRKYGEVVLRLSRASV
jgi:EcsC protein family